MLTFNFLNKQTNIMSCSILCLGNLREDSLQESATLISGLRGQWGYFVVDQMVSRSFLEALQPLAQSGLLHIPITFR